MARPERGGRGFSRRRKYCRFTAEGIEHEAQRNALIQLGCGSLQGFLLAKPMPPEALIGFLAHAMPAGKGNTLATPAAPRSPAPAMAPH